MRQIRARIREKRGADYTEAELQQLAKRQAREVSRSARRALGSRRAVPPPPRRQRRRRRSSSSEDITLYGTHRGAARRDPAAPPSDPEAVHQPEPDHPRVHSLTVQQAQVNEEFHRRFRQREEMDPLYYEVMHNLVARDDAARHRGAQPQDARRVAVEPDGLRRTPRTVARSASSSTGPAPGRPRAADAPRPAGPSCRLRPSPPARRRGPRRRPDATRREAPRRSAGAATGERRRPATDDGRAPAATGAGGVPPGAAASPRRPARRRAGGRTARTAGTAGGRRRPKHRRRTRARRRPTSDDGATDQ